MTQTTNQPLSNRGMPGFLKWTMRKSMELECARCVEGFYFGSIWNPCRSFWTIVDYVKGLSGYTIVSNQLSLHKRASNMSLLVSPLQSNRTTDMSTGASSRSMKSISRSLKGICSTFKPWPRRAVAATQITAGAAPCPSSVLWRGLATPVSLWMYSCSILLGTGKTSYQ